MPFPLLAPLLMLAIQEPAPPGDWQKTLEASRQALIQKNGPGTDTALRDQLLTMRDRDQLARGMQGGERTGKLSDVDAALTAEMKQIAETRGWPTIRLVGIEASNAAMLILTHTADHVWQRALLPQLEGLADAGRIDGSALALVVDKELIASGQLQRYGSQFKAVSGGMAMYAVEDPAGLDRRRAQVLLPPMEVYRATLSEMYHLKVLPQIVSPSR